MGLLKCDINCFKWIVLFLQSKTYPLWKQNWLYLDQLLNHINSFRFCFAAFQEADPWWFQWRLQQASSCPSTGPVWENESMGNWVQFKLFINTSKVDQKGNNLQTEVYLMLSYIRIKIIWRHCKHDLKYKILWKGVPEMSHLKPYISTSFLDVPDNLELDIFRRVVVRDGGSSEPRSPQKQDQKFKVEQRILTIEVSYSFTAS